MFRIGFKAPKLVFKRLQFEKTLRDRLQVQIRQAARDFVRAAVDKIPIDTGQARGTFLPLGRFLRVAVPIVGNTPQENKNPITGADNKNRLVFKFLSQKSGEYFEFEPQLLYFILNDFLQMNYKTGNATPWQSIESGTEAFVNYIKTEGFRKLPRLKDFVAVVYEK